MRLPRCLVAVSVALLLAAPAHAAERAVKLDPLTLPVGPATGVPHVEGTTLVDGRLRLPVRGEEVRYVGQVGSQYVLDVDQPRRRGSVVLLARDGSITRLATGGRFDSVLAEDGATVVTALSRTPRRTTVTAYAVDSGAAVATHVFRDLVLPLAARGTEAVLRSSGRPGTLRWDSATDTVTEVTRRYGARADIGHDLLASFTSDGGVAACTVVSRLSDPAVELWRSCDDAVIAFSTDGTHLATSYLAGEGYPSYTRVSLRTIGGTAVATYRVRGGRFMRAVFESGTGLLLEPVLLHADGANAAYVRCERRTCERAGRTYRSDVFD